MNFTTFKEGTELIKQAANIDFNVFIHDIESAVLQDFLLPPDRDAGRDYLYINCVFVLVDHRWLFLTNANSAPKSSIVNMYMSCEEFPTSTLDPKLLKLINHYFLQRQQLKVYQITDSSPFDPNDTILSLFNLYSTVVENRFIRENLLHREDAVQNVVKHFQMSCEQQKLLPFHRSVFRDMTESILSIETVQILDDDQLKEQRAEEAMRRNARPIVGSRSLTSSQFDRGIVDRSEMISKTSFSPVGILSPEALFNVESENVQHSTGISTEFDIDYNSDDTYTKVLERQDKKLIQSVKNKMICHKLQCLSNKKVARVTHYHCLRCQKFKYKDFYRVIKHSASTCSSRVEKVIAQPKSSVTDETEDVVGEPKSSVTDETEDVVGEPKSSVTDETEDVVGEPKSSVTDETEDVVGEPKSSVTDETEDVVGEPKSSVTDETEDVVGEPKSSVTDETEDVVGEPKSSVTDETEDVVGEPKSSVTDEVKKVVGEPKPSVLVETRELLDQSQLTAALRSRDMGAFGPFKQRMSCKNPNCFVKPRSNPRILHFHCLLCKSHFSIEFKREVTHMLKCPTASFVPITRSSNVSETTNTLQTNDVNSTKSGNENQSADREDRKIFSESKATPDDTSHAEEKDISICWDSRERCIVRSGRGKTKHYHCKTCGLANTEIERIRNHLIKCRVKSHKALKVDNCQNSGVNASLSSGRSLQAELVCARDSIYLVRRGSQGPAAPVHVKVGKDGWECTAPQCQDMYNFHRGSLIPSFLCDHAKACVDHNIPPKPDLVNDTLQFTTFGEEEREILLSFCKTARNFGFPVVKQFLPDMVGDETTSRYIYYSVFAGEGDNKYYSKLGRVLVTYDRSTKTHKCDCNIRSCVHRKIAVLVSQVNPLVQESRPEDGVNEEEIKFANAMMDYVLEHKVIPFDVSNYMNPAEKVEFSPVETVCHKCSDVKLVVSDTNNRGCIFTLDRKKTGIKVITKSCPQCSMQFRYAEYSEGYFNYNNSSFFSLPLMETAVTAWTKNVSITSFFEIMKVSTQMQYNIHLILDAVKAYLALKDLNVDNNLSCYCCGYFPVCLTYDVIRSVCFDVNPSDVIKHEYKSSAMMANDCSRYGLAKAYLNRKSVQYRSNIQHFSVKLGPHLPPLTSSHNFGGLAPYTRPLVDRDRAEEVRLPLERIEQLVASKGAYKELKRICESLNIETKGGKSHMVTRLVDNEGNAKLYSVVRKNFTKMVGKSGGVLRAFCPHGICYGIKFLTLPESVADYTNMMTAFKVQPNFNFTDMPSVVANHTCNHYPNFFRPYRGRIDSPTDPMSDLYKDGRKKALFDFNTFTTSTIDVEKYDHNSVHPVSLLSSVLSLSDIFHEKNHHEFDAHLRSVNSTNLAAKWNTSVVEQNNHVLAMKKSYCNEMGVNNHIRFLSYLTCAHNKKVNDAWKAKMEKNTKKECVVDEMGFLVVKGVDKSTTCGAKLDIPSTNNVKSPHPTAVLQDPSGDASAFNSVVYALSLSHLGESIMGSSDHISYELLQIVNGLAHYDQKTHFKIKGLIDKKVSKAGGSASDPVSLFTEAFLPDLKSQGTLLIVEEPSSPNIGLALKQCIQSHGSLFDYVVMIRSPESPYLNGFKPHFHLEQADAQVKYRLAAYISKTAMTRLIRALLAKKAIFTRCVTQDQLYLQRIHFLSLQGLLI